MKKQLIAAAAALSLTMDHALAQDLKSKFLNNFATAVAVGAKCKAWKVNPETAMPVMKSFKMTMDDISPGGSDWPLFQQDIQWAQEDLLDGLDDDEICTAAATLFGPNGVVGPNLMVTTGGGRQVRQGEAAVGH